MASRFVPCAIAVSLEDVHVHHAYLLHLQRKAKGVAAAGAARKSPCSLTLGWVILLMFDSLTYFSSTLHSARDRILVSRAVAFVVALHHVHATSPSRLSSHAPSHTQCTSLPCSFALSFVFSSTNISNSRLALGNSSPFNLSMTSNKCTL